MRLLRRLFLTLYRDDRVPQGVINKLRKFIEQTEARCPLFAPTSPIDARNYKRRYVVDSKTKKANQTSG